MTFTNSLSVITSRPKREKSISDIITYNTIYKVPNLGIYRVEDDRSGLRREASCVHNYASKHDEQHPMHSKRASTLRALLSTASLIVTLAFVAPTPATADDVSDCDKLADQARSYVRQNDDKALECYMKALKLAKRIASKERSISEQLDIEQNIAGIFSRKNNDAEAEKYNREIIKLGEPDLESYGDFVSRAYSALATSLLRAGKQIEGQQCSEKSNNAYKTWRQASLKKAEEKQLKDLTTNYDKALKETGENSDQTFSAARPLAQYYIAHNQLKEAKPLVVLMVSYSRDEKHYFDAGAEWDERRRNHEPTQGTTKINVNGKELDATYIDNRRPSGKLNRSDLICYLYALSELDKKLGKTIIAGAQKDEAKKIYSRYQMENLSLLFTGFESFIAGRSIGPSTTTSQIESLLKPNCN